MRTYRFVVREFINGEVDEIEICKIKSDLKENQAIYRQFKNNHHLPDVNFVDYLKKIGFDPQVEVTIILNEP